MAIETSVPSTKDAPKTSPRLSRLSLRAGDGFALLAALLILLPTLVAALAGLFAPVSEAWQHILTQSLARYALGTVSVMAVTGVLVLLAGVATAWFVTVSRFYGRAVFEWALVLPLALPGYVIAYAYADLFSVAGPLQSGLRDLTGWSARDYWFPTLDNPIGAGFVLGAALFPYVYLTARAAFLTQSVCAIEAARSLGAGPGRTFWRIVLPAARPAIAAGLALALMEAAADYGAVAFLGVETLTTGIFKAWGSFSDPGAAARIALALLAIALVLQVIERTERRGAGYAGISARWRALPHLALGPLARFGVFSLCALVLAWGFAIPMIRLIWLAIESGWPGRDLSAALSNSVILASLGAGTAFVLALIVALAARSGSRAGRIASLAASAGYAVPGAVLALGALLAVSALQGLGVAANLGGGLAIAALIWTYASRFTAAGSSPLEAALERAPRTMGWAARSLSAGPARRLFRLDLPIAASGAWTAALILFVEILKELPATLLLRPFNWDTLAVRAHAYASDERLASAAAPALLICLAGLLPVIILSRRIARARPGHGHEAPAIRLEMDAP
jgi:iron(III) transport system permease protein